MSTDGDRVREYFSRSAVSFDSLYAEHEMRRVTRWVNTRFRRDIYERFLRTLEHARAHGLNSVLDVGCGSGRYLMAFRELGMQRIAGVDVSPRMIELCRENQALLASPNEITLICADFCDFETSQRFDLAVAMGVFDYIRDPAPLLSKMASMATHSVVASFPSRSWYRTPIRKLRYAAKRCPLYFYDEGGIQEVAARAGLQSLEITKIRGAGMDYFVTIRKEQQEDPASSG